MAASSQAPSGPEYEQLFLQILHNEDKYLKPPRNSPRNAGFVVLVRGGDSLKPFQELCLNHERQPRNTCYTARYRLRPKMAIGTLLASWLADSRKIALDQKDLAGDLRFGPGDRISVRQDGADVSVAVESSDGWRRLASRFLSLTSSSQISGVIEQRELNAVIKELSNESVLHVGERLVLFCELSEAAIVRPEWDAAMDILFQRLPERMGIVVSGAPPDVGLPTDDPRFLEITVPKDYAVLAGPGTLAYRYIDSSFHSDLPTAKDELDVNRYANAIARFVLHPQTTPPLTIGIHGPWGKGKSSFMELVDKALVKYAEVNRAANTQKWNDLSAKLVQAESVQAAMGNEQLSEDEKERRPIEYENLKEEERTLWQEMEEAAEKNVLPIWFNAWQFEDAKQTWAGLASVISERMETLLPQRARQWLKIKYAWKERRAELILNVLSPFGMLFAVGVFRGVVVPKQDSGIGGLLQLILPVGSMFITIWFVCSQFVRIAQPISARVLSYVAMPDYRDQMGFQHRVRDDVKFVYEFLSTRLNTSSFNRAGRFRVVVYIDDLDRCSENKIMELLQAINLILADCKFFVFVGMDTEMIYRAIKAYYKENVTDRFADNYLSKVIQISFYLPDTKLQTRSGYLSTLFSLTSRLELAERVKATGHQPVPRSESQLSASQGALPYDLTQILKIVPLQIKEAEDTSHELEAFSDYCDFIDDNPREMKRLINIHRLIKILVQNPNIPLNTDRQKKLVKWLIFCDTWPHLVGNVLDEARKTASQNCLLDLATSLENAAAEPKSTQSVPAFDGLKNFAEYVRPIDRQRLTVAEIPAEENRFEEERKVYALSSADIDDDFRLAAKLSQMVRKPIRNA
jgi:hypothetical protein